MFCRKAYLGAIVITCCSCFFRVTAYSQDKQAENRKMYFAIQNVRHITADSLVAVISGGSRYGISIGETAPVKGSAKPGSNRFNLELGFASVLSTTDTTSTISIRQKDAAGDSNIIIRAGDFVSLNIKVPKQNFHSIFFELALKNINLNSLKGQPLFIFDQVLFKDSKRLEDSLLKMFVKDFDEAIKILQGDSIKYAGYFSPVKEGRYTGKTSFDVMRKSTARDIHNFLCYILENEDDYVANSWGFTRNFGLWVDKNAPYSRREIYDSIAYLKSNAAELKNFIERHRKLIVEGEYVKAWVKETLKAWQVRDEKKIKELFEISKLVLSYLNDDCSNGYYYYSYSDIAGNMGNFIQAITLTDSAFESFTKCGNYSSAAEALFMKAFLLDYLKRSDESLVVFEAVNRLLKTYDTKLTAEDKFIITMNYYRGSGYVYSTKDDYKLAIESFTKLIELLKKKNTFQNLNEVAQKLLEVAKIYMKQGEYTKALEIYNEQLRNYIYLGDKKNQADVLDNLGYIQSKLGNSRTAIEYFEQAKQLHLWLSDYSNAGYSQSSIGQNLWTLGNFVSAIQAHTLAIEYRNKADDFAGKAYSWSKLADLYKLTGQKPKALAAYDSTALYYAIAKDSTSLINNLLDVGEVYNIDKQYQKAFDYFNKAHGLNVAKGIKSAIINSLFKLASVTFFFDVPSSKKYYAECYKLAKEIGDKSSMMYSSANLGGLASNEYDLELAEKYFNEALQLSLEEKNKPNEAYCYNMIGMASTAQLNFDKAISYCTKALNIYDSLGDRTKLPSLYGKIAQALQDKGEINNAKATYEKAATLAGDIKSMAEVGELNNSLSFLYMLSGDKKNAVRLADSSLVIFKELNNAWQMANAYNSLGNVYTAINQYSKAIGYYLLADSIYIREKSDWARSTVRNNIANTYFYQADYNRALENFLQCEKLLLKVKTITESHLLAKTNIGETYYHKKDYAKALKYMNDARTLAEQKGAVRILKSIALISGKISYDLLKLDDAERYLKEAQQLSNKINEGESIIESALYLGKVYALKNDTAKSIENLNASIEHSKKIESSKFLWEAFYELGMLYYKRNNFDSAVDYFKLADVVIEKNSENLFGGAEAKKIFSADYKKVDVYNKLVASLVKLNRGDEALYYADKSNSQGVKQLLEQSGIASEDKQKNQALQKANELALTQTTLEKTIAKEIAKPVQQQNKVLIDSLVKYKLVAAKDYLNYISNLVKTYPDLQVYFTKTNPVDFKNYMEFIPDSTIIVLYVINDNQLYLFTATKDETLIKVVDLKTDINQQAARFLSLLKNPGIKTGTEALKTRSNLKIAPAAAGDYKKEASALYDILITPIAEQLKDKKNLCIIPNGKLSNIPFQALGSYKEGNAFHFLVEDYRLFYTNKLEIFMKPYKQQQILNSFVAMGNPDKSLPKATAEVNNLLKIISSGKSYIEDAATEDIAKTSLTGFRYIHLATHGVLDYSNFENSFLLFGINKSYKNEEGVAEDGKLTISEINGLSIKDCDLVTLSACETAVTQESVKGWYISPANSFLANRVKSVVASLWQVDDEATSILMDEFYKNLQQMPKAEALRKAQETLSKNPKYTHPYYWSAFVLYGDWR